VSALAERYRGLRSRGFDRVRALDALVRETGIDYPTLRKSLRASGVLGEFPPDRLRSAPALARELDEQQRREAAEAEADYAQARCRRRGRHGNHRRSDVW
jgi:hypothetical protein